ncbi:amidase [Halotalea alkalilenta]|uniref:amidase n=1 Tax=Halotalea alkalilenta TaxID=376489 RepID=UPI00069480BE|nr:amidase [Halotalea alkalilenta]
MNIEDVQGDEPFALMPYPPASVAHAEQGPLAGLSFAVKDLFDVAGYPTSGGNPTLLAMSGIKRTTAPTVQRLLDSGARMIGKAQTNEMAFSMSGKNAHFGTPRNGAAPQRIPGGSSSGSASAVSNGLCDFALGTDTGGSVRTPASYCGLYGLRPSHGRISLEGCQPLCASMDTCGFFARDPEVFQRVAECLLGEDSAPLIEAPALSSAVLMEMLPAASRAALAPALARIERACSGIEAFSDQWPSLEEAYWAFRYIQGREAWQAQGETILRHGLVLGPDVSARFSWGRQVSDEQLAEAIAFRARFRDAVDAMLGDRVLVLPTVADIAPRLDAKDEEIEAARTIAHHLLGIAVLCGLPQVNLPLAEKDGAPLGISLLAGRGRDLALVRLAARIGASVEG